MGINRGGGSKQRVNVACSVTAEVIAAFALFFHSWFYLTLDHPTQFLKSPGFSFKVVSVVNAQAHNYHPSAFKLNWNCITSRGSIPCVLRHNDTPSKTGQMYTVSDYVWSLAISPSRWLQQFSLDRLETTCCSLICLMLFPSVWW